MAVAIVLAAGSGSRMNTDIAKQFLMIRGKEVLYYSLRTFQESDSIEGIILVTRSEDVEFCRTNIVEKYGFDKVKSVCEGGSERYYSVYNGLLKVKDIYGDDCDIVMIHDGARPFVTDAMIQKSIAVIKNGHSGCTVGMPVKDTIKIVSEIDGQIVGTDTPDRKTLYQIQTPQTFKLDVLMTAYNRLIEDENHNITDDTMVVEQYAGVQSVVIDGAYENIKITTPEDMEIAEKLVEKIFQNF